MPIHPIGVRSIPLDYCWSLQVALTTELFHWKPLRYYPDETITYMDETLPKAGAQDSGHGGSMLWHSQSGYWQLLQRFSLSVLLIPIYLRKKSPVTASITSERLWLSLVSAIEKLKQSLAKSHAETLWDRARTHTLARCLPSMAMVEQNVGGG